MCQLHWHCKSEAKKYMEHVNTYANEILRMVRGEKPVYENRKIYEVKID